MSAFIGGQGGRRTQSPKEQLAEFMLEWSAAIVSNDVTKMGAFTTEDWVLIDRPGAITREAFHRVVSDGSLRHHSMDHDILDIRCIDRLAIVRTHGRNTATFNGEPVRADEWTTNILLDDGNQWRCMLTQLTPMAGDPG
ncbi:nuclear transport factor 2 family protein [Phycicoccus jejuensis]|uniref:nuclear transport factor 2 family protein n=1 Tax=Phycicoccus jejuensis TaxID=367299 RepID=UPI0006896854|nr:nuclear transport factor 2 family protein [Phycicoccus jejuensis]